MIIYNLYKLIQYYTINLHIVHSCIIFGQKFIKIFDTDPNAKVKCY